MQKIICLIESLGSGGAERQLSGLAVLLKQEGYNVEVWYYAPNHFYRDNLDRAGVTYRFWEKARDKKKRIGIIRKELLKAKPDTVITYLDTPCIIGCIAKLTGGKFSLIVSERNTTQKIGIKERLKFFLYRFADYIVPNSETQAQFIKHNFPSLSNKIWCITNFVDTDNFKPSKHENNSDEIRVLTVARVMPQKNVLNYIYAVKKVVDSGRKIKFDWYGEPLSREYYEHCQNLIKELRLSSVFHFKRASSNIVEEYTTSTFFCLPSIYEGFPNVVCEAMSCGLPILCSDVCDNPNIVTNATGFLFSPHNAESIASAIMMASDMSDEEYRKMQNACRERALQLFSKTSFLNSYNEILQ